MRKCPNCDKPVKNTASACSACGQKMPSGVEGTLDADAMLSDSTSTDNVAASDESPAPPAAGPSGTLQLPDSEDPTQPGGTLEMPESGEPPAEGGTLQMPDENAAAGPIDPSSTSAKTVHEMGKTVDFDSDEPASTIDLDFSASANDASVRGTIQYSDGDIASAKSSSSKSGSGKSGTAGRLKRLWMGAAGSSSSPMHTLKGSDAQASDSVFERVAARVLVPDADIRIHEISGTSTSSEPSRKIRVEECIAAACRGASSEAADYDLTGFLGQGGMGVVLKARQRAIGREVALKMVQPSKGESASSTLATQKKFFYEAQITGKLDHPNIVPIYELGISNEILFYSMKMIVGTEWKDVIASKSPDENLDILMKISDAMAFAHEKGVIHRDLKPENVMLGPFGEVLVTDWGCAVDLTRNEKFTGAGSPPWMAPEMAAHEMDRIGPKSDIYLIGAMLYQVIEGYPPHPGRTVWECIQAAAKNVILPHKDDDPLMDIALRAMASDPDDRYADVAAMQEAIREYRRHAESITLTERSDALLTQAIESRDYERFSRTVFGYRDAIELWPQNKAAVSGLQSASLAYGQCAFDKGDYDLCLQTLDKRIPAQGKLYAEAAKAKQAADERDNRFKTLRKVLAAVVIFAMVGLSSLSGYAWLQKSNAEASELVAKKETSKAVAAVESEKKAKLSAEKAKEDAIASEKAALAAEIVAEGAKEEALVAKDAALNARDFAQREKLKADAAALAARKSEADAVIARDQAQEQRQLADQRTREVELGAYQSKLSLAMSDAKQLNILGARQGLAELAADSTFEILNNSENPPKFENWAVNRVELLTNSKLLQNPLGQSASAVAFAADANRGLAATSNQVDGSGPGLLHVLHFANKQLVVERSIETPVAVSNLAISADGMQAAYSLSPEVGISESKVYTLDLAAAQAEPIEVAEYATHELQELAISKNRLVGGINGGMHVWSRNQNTWEHQRLPRVKGTLLSLQLLSDSVALVLAEANGQRTIYNIDLNDTNRRSSIAFDISPDSELADEQVSAVSYFGERMIVGTESGKLFTAPYALTSASVGPVFWEIEPRKHQSAIRSIHVHQDGTLLTVAAEPVAYVWQASAKESGWKYATYLAGATSNLADAAFMANPSLVLGLGQDGTPIAWDVQRQTQRQQLRRVEANGQVLEYSSPVKQVVTAADGQRAVSIHADGTLDAWDMQTGRTLGAGGTIPFEFVGHSPGAKFEDMAVDSQAGVLMTSAVLPADSATQLPAGQRNWEYCKWDLASGLMLERWTRPSATPQQISLLGAGQLVLYASNTTTDIAEAKGKGDLKFQGENFSSFFAVENPASKNLVMLVKSNGAVRVFDTSDESSFDAQSNRLDYELAENSALQSATDVPLVGSWSDAGNRFYMIWRSGRITEFSWENSRLAIKRDLGEAELKQLKIQLDAGAGAADEAGTIQLQSREQLDVRVQTQGRYNLLNYSVRFPGAEGRTRVVRVVFPLESGAPVAEKAESNLGRYRLILNDDASPTADDALLEKLPVNSYQVAAVRKLGDTSYVATTEGIVYAVSLQDEVKVLGRPAMLSASGNALAKRVVTLHEGGVMWRGDENAGQWTWSALKAAPANTQAVAMSPDGTQLLLTVASAAGVQQLLTADAESGQVLGSKDGGVYGSWSPTGEMAYVDQDGGVWLQEQAGQRQVGQLQGDWQPRSLHFFTEAWAGAKPVNRWIVVHAENGSSASRDGKLEYFSLDQDLPAKERSTPLARGTDVLACSPVEGVFVTGGYGTVEVRFASPTLDEFNKVLFGLEGHAGAQMECLTFSGDGQTLISTDSKNRQYAWLSHDALDGIATSPAGASPVVQ